MTNENRGLATSDEETKKESHVKVKVPHIMKED